MNKLIDTQSINTKSLAVDKSPTKMELLSYIASETKLSQKNVDDVFKSLKRIIGKTLHQTIPFSFIGLLKFYIVEKEARKEEKKLNPFTGEMTTFAAKPAHKAVRVKPLKQLKELVNQKEAE